MRIKLLPAVFALVMALSPSLRADESGFFGRIATANAQGSLTEDEAWRSKILAVYAPEQLDPSLRGPAVLCGTPLVEELRNAYPRLSPENQSLLLKYDGAAGGRHASAAAGFDETNLSSTVLDQTRTVTVGNDIYLIHYTTSGVDATTTAYLDTLQAAIEYVVPLHRDTYGYPTPIHFNFETEATDAYHIYLSNQGLSNTLFGKVQAQGFFQDNPKSAATEHDALPSYMVIHASIDPQVFGDDPNMNILKITFAHEHFHSIQFSTSFMDAATKTSGQADTAKQSLRTWLQESTAAFQEPMAYPAISNGFYSYTNGVFAAPQVNLFTESLSGNTNFRHYGNFMLHKYLDEHSDNAGRTAVMKVYTDAAVSAAAQNGQTPASLYINAVEQNTSYTSFVDLMKEYTIATILRSATVTGGNGKYTFSQASFMQTGSQGDFPFTVLDEQTFTGQALTLAASNNLESLGANYYALTMNQAGGVTLSSTSGNLSFAAVYLGANADITPANARTSLTASVVGEQAVAEGGSGSMNLTQTGDYLIRVLNTDINPTSTAKASYTAAVGALTNVTISCGLTGDGLTHPHVGDAAKLLGILNGSGATTCVGGACDFNKSGNTTPDASDLTALASIILGGDTNNVCGSTFGN